jgi:hypothetical protein
MISISLTGFNLLENSMGGSMEFDRFLTTVWAWGVVPVLVVGSLFLFFLGGVMLFTK